MKKSLRKRAWKKDWTFVHINTQKIRECNALRRKALDGEMCEAAALEAMPDAITVKNGKLNHYGSTVLIYHPITGEELGWFEHTPFDPYSCGAQIVFKTQMCVKVFPHKSEVHAPVVRMSVCNS